MVFISRNFFDYKYDYREEWLKMTRELANLGDDPPLPERVIGILAGLVESNAGALWLQDDQKNYILQASLNMTVPRYTIIDRDAELVMYLQEREWIIDLTDYEATALAHKLPRHPYQATERLADYSALPREGPLWNGGCWQILGERGAELGKL